MSQQRKLSFYFTIKEIKNKNKKTRLPMCGTYLVDIQTKKRKSSLDFKNLTYLVFPSPRPRNPEENL